MPKTLIGAHLIIFGGRVKEDIKGVLEDVKAAGYSGIEAFAGVGDIKELLDDVGLECAGVHMAFRDCAKIDEIIPLLHSNGAQYLMCSGVGDREQGIAAYEGAAETFNEVGAKCREAGIVFGYHNHDWEFQDRAADGRPALERLYELTDPDLVAANVDVYWVMVGGDDPAVFVDKYASRIKWIHLKDGVPGCFAELGNGDVPWESTIPAVKSLNLPWLIVEQDNSDKDPKESCTISRAFLRNHGL